MANGFDISLRKRYKEIVEKHNYPYLGLFVPSENPCGKILFVGYNPSLGDEPQKDDFPKFSEIIEKDFWKPVKELANEIIDDVAYLDLFPIRSSNQLYLEDEKHFKLRAELLEITQQEIEEHIKPKLIVMLNRSAAYYWGTNSEALWMGYDFQPSTFGDIRGNKVLRICDFKESQHGNMRINVNKYSYQNSSIVLDKTHILFYRQLHATRRNEYPTESIITPNELSILWRKIQSMTK